MTCSPGLPVPSARRGLTALFGMGRGGTPALSPPYLFLSFSILVYSLLSYLFSLFSFPLSAWPLPLSSVFLFSPCVLFYLFGVPLSDAEHLPFGLKHIDGNDLLGLDSLFLFSVPQLLSDLAPQCLRTL